MDDLARLYHLQLRYQMFNVWYNKLPFFEFNNTVYEIGYNQVVFTT